jgi:hypothetical protein
LTGQPGHRTPHLNAVVSQSLCGGGDGQLVNGELVNDDLAGLGLSQHGCQANALRFLKICVLECFAENIGNHWGIGQCRDVKLRKVIAMDIISPNRDVIVVVCAGGKKIRSVWFDVAATNSY